MGSDPDYLTDWAALQRRYLEALQVMGGSGAGVATPGANPWQDALDFWWQRASAAVSDEQRGVFTDIVRQSRSFLESAAFFGPLIEILSQPGAAGSDWDRDLRGQIAAMQRKLREGAVPPGMEAILGAWKVPDDFWDRISALVARLPEEGLQLYDTTAPGQGKRVAAGESVREGARLWQEYQRALSEYLRMLSDAARVALDRLQHRLSGGAKVNSLRSLYDLWVDCGEDAYAEMMFGADFARCFAELVNALCAFKLHTRGMIDAGLDALNLPTVRALDGVYRREADLRSELRTTRSRQEEDRETLLRLQRELELLRQVVQRKDGAGGV